jgi:hypothetical protein
LNPRPKTIIPGFYILILNFDISRKVSFRRDTRRYSLRNLTVMDQATKTAVLQSRRPDLRSARGISAGRQRVLGRYGVIIIVCDYL